MRNLAPVKVLLGGILLAAILAGCTADQAARNVYEGIQVHNQGRALPDKPAAGAPSYDEYERERRALSNPKPE